MEGNKTTSSFHVQHLETMVVLSVCQKTKGRWKIVDNGVVLFLEGGYIWRMPNLSERAQELAKLRVNKKRQILTTIKQNGPCYIEKTVIYPVLLYEANTFYIDGSPYFSIIPEGVLKPHQFPIEKAKKYNLELDDFGFPVIGM